MSVTMLKRLFTAALAVAGGLMLTAASKPLPPENPGGQNWNTVVTTTDHDSYILGDTKAKLKLVEYISYTCPHCAHFEEQADAPLRLGLVATDRGSVEVRSFIRDPIDLTVALLTHCGDKSNFFMNNAMFLREQSTWIMPLVNASNMDKQRWMTGDFATRTRHIAQDFGFYKMMSDRGYDRIDVDRCLGDQALAKRLADDTAKYAKEYDIQGTPSFMINGILLAGTYDWDSLRPQIDARLDEGD